MNLVDRRNRREAFKKKTLGPHSRPLKWKGQGWVQECFVLFSFFLFFHFFFKSSPQDFWEKMAEKEFNQRTVLSQQQEVKINSQEIYQQQKRNQKRRGYKLSPYVLRGGGRGEGPKTLGQHGLEAGPVLTATGNMPLDLKTDAQRSKLRREQAWEGGGPAHHPDSRIWTGAGAGHLISTLQGLQAECLRGDHPKHGDSKGTGYTTFDLVE